MKKKRRKGETLLVGDLIKSKKLMGKFINQLLKLDKIEEVLCQKTQK